MYETLRIVLDTNVLISAIVGHGKPRQLVVRLLSGQRHQIVSSHQMLAELADVLSREKFREVDKSQVGSFLPIHGSKATTTLITVNQVKEVIKIQMMT